METLRLTQNALTGLDDEKKKKLKEKLDSGAFAIEIVEEPKEELVNDLALPATTVDTPKKEQPKEDEQGFLSKAWDFVTKPVSKEEGQKIIEKTSIYSPDDAVEDLVGLGVDATGIKDDVSWQTYEQIGLLSKTASGLHDIGIGEVKQEDIETYNKNLSSLLIEKMGYKDVLTTHK